MRVATFNVWQNNSRPRAGMIRLAAEGPVVIAVQEARRHDNELKRVPGYRHIESVVTSGKRELSQDLVTLVRKKDAKVLFSYVVQLTKALEVGGLGHERYVQITHIEYKNQEWRILNVHMPAGVLNPKGRFHKIRRAREWRRYMKWINWYLRSLSTQQRRNTIILGDFNFDERGKNSRSKKLRWSPWKAFKRINFKYTGHRVDGFAVHGSRSVKNSVKLAPAATGSDHWALVFDVV